MTCLKKLSSYSRYLSTKSFYFIFINKIKKNESLSPEACFTFSSIIKEIEKKAKKNEKFIYSPLFNKNDQYINQSS